MLQEFITEKVITHIYRKHNEVQLKNLEAKFLKETEGLAQQFTDWLAYDYVANTEKRSYAEAYLEDMEGQLEEGEIKYIKNRINSYLGFYEVLKLKENSLQIKNLFTNELHSLSKADLEEEVNLHEILLIRITNGDLPQIVSSQITVLPYQFKTLLIGQVIENYDLIKERKPYLTFPQYFKENLLAVLGIVNRLLSFKNQEGDVTLYQSLYAVKNYKAVKELFTQLNQVVEEDQGDGLYHLMDEDLLLAEMVLQKERLEVECNNKEDQKTAKEILADQLGEHLVHLKDEELSIDDLI
ncbi:hypothetical protein [Alkaliphilus transvaalensis]|uniref:hypothetical protein n=1 Tax=Alkaliphilus transvaalensis TaxID=114628 RepID=UPI000478F75A|nr:hypothetical protein [Alkaliphilus transvaalensis]